MQYIRIDVGNQIVEYVGDLNFFETQQYPLGEQLLRFVYFDLTEYEQRRQKVLHTLTDTEEYEQIKKKYSNFSDETIRLASDLFLRSDTLESEDVVTRVNNGLFWFLIFGEDENSLKHKYFGRMWMDAPYEANFEREIEESYNYIDLQNKHLNAMEFCMDVEYKKDLLGDLSTIERFFIYNSSFRDGDYFSAAYENKYISAPVIKQGVPIEFDFEVLHEPYSNDWENPLPRPITREVIDYVKSMKLSFKELYNPSSVRESAYLEFMKMVEANIKVKKCGNCGRYFIVKGSYDAKYCERVPDGETRTCQTIAATNNYKAKVEADPILKEYNRAYKRVFARQKNKKMSQKDFMLWADEAKKMRRKAQDQEISLQEFKQWLGNK